VGECFFAYRLTRVVPDKGPLNGCVSVCLFIYYSLFYLLAFYLSGGSVAEWLACWTQAQKGPGSNRSRDAVE